MKEEYDRFKKFLEIKPYMGVTHQTPKRYLWDTVEEIRSVIKEKEDQYFARAEIQRLGYKVKFEWIKGDEIGRVINLSSKKEWRVQISPAEPFGYYLKAWVAILSYKDYANTK